MRVRPVVLSVLAVVVAAAGLSSAAGASPAEGDTAARAATISTGAACPAGQVPSADFWDVEGPHLVNVDCVAWWRVAAGTNLVHYAPVAPVTRAQMATFVARTLDRLGVALPPAPSGPPRFADVTEGPHRANIERLAEAGIVAGVDDGTRYGPERPVPRGQMATFLVRTWEYATAEELPAGQHSFTDIAGHPHEANIVAATTVGFAAGTTATTYEPDLRLNRAQMATFLARVLAAGVDAFDVSLPDPARLRLSGTGNDVIWGTIPNHTPALATFTHHGRSNFIVWVRDERNERVDLLANEIGPYHGTTTVNFGQFTGNLHGLEVTADGNWSVRLRPLAAAQGFGPGGGAGAGDDVVEASALAGRTVHLTHRGHSNFIIWAHDGNGDEVDLVANEIGDHDGVVILDPRTRWLRITADGHWSITPR